MIEFPQDESLESLELLKLRFLDHALMNLFDPRRSQISQIDMQQWVFLDYQHDHLEVCDFDDEQKQPIFIQILEQKMDLLKHYYGKSFELRDLLRLGQRICRNKMALYCRNRQDCQADEVEETVRESKAALFNAVFPVSYLKTWQRFEQ